MKLLPLLKKESFWSKRKIGLLLFLFLLLPAFFVLITQSFERTVPRNIPVAVLPENENVSRKDLETVANTIDLFSEPTVTNSKSEALDTLRKEETYVAIEVPPYLGGDNNDNSVFTIYVDGGMTPIQKSSEYLIGVASGYLQELSPNIQLELHTVGDAKTMSEYLFPSFLFLVIMILALLYVPYNLSEDEDMLERLRVDASLDSMVAAKIIFFAFLIFIPILVFWATSAYFGASIEILTRGSIIFSLLTFVYLSCIGMAVTFFAGFSNWGRIFNILLLFFLLTFSSFFYPIGFFGSGIQQVGAFMPTLYSMVAARGFLLRGLEFSYFLDWFLILLTFTAFALLLLKASIEYHKRRD